MMDDDHDGIRDDGSEGVEAAPIMCSDACFKTNMTTAGSSEGTTTPNSSKSDCYMNYVKKEPDVVSISFYKCQNVRTGISVDLAGNSAADGIRISNVKVGEGYVFPSQSFLDNLPIQVGDILIGINAESFDDDDRILRKASSSSGDDDDQKQSTNNEDSEQEESNLTTMDAMRMLRSASGLVTIRFRPRNVPSSSCNVGSKRRQSKEKFEVSQAIFFDAASALSQNSLATTCRLAFDLDLYNDSPEQDGESGDSPDQEKSNDSSDPQTTPQDDEKDEEVDGSSIPQAIILQGESNEDNTKVDGTNKTSTVPQGDGVGKQAGVDVTNETRATDQDCESNTHKVNFNNMPVGTGTLKVHSLRGEWLKGSCLHPGQTVLAINDVPVYEMDADEALPFMSSQLQQISSTYASLTSEGDYNNNNHNGHVVSIKTCTIIGSSRSNMTIKDHLRRSAVAAGGSTLLGIGTLMLFTPIHPVGHVLQLGGLATLGTEFEGPRKAANRIQNSFRSAWTKGRDGRSSREQHDQQQDEQSDNARVDESRYQKRA